MKLRRLRLIVVLVLSLLTASLVAEAQQAGKVWRIGYLSLAADVDPYKSRLTAFREGLQTLGYVEGEKVSIEQRYAAGRPERLPELAAELVRLKVDVLGAYHQ